MPTDPDPFSDLKVWEKCACTLRDMYKFTEQIQCTQDIPIQLRRDANSATIELMKMHVFIMQELLKRQARLMGNIPEKLANDIQSNVTANRKNIT